MKHLCHDPTSVATNNSRRIDASVKILGVVDVVVVAVVHGSKLVANKAAAAKVVSAASAGSVEKPGTFNKTVLSRRRPKKSKKQLRK